MKKRNSLFSLWGFAVTSLLGTILHFLYDLTNESPLIAPFSAVNESTWEHMKLLFFPMLLFAIVQSFFYKNEPNFWCIKLKGTLMGLSLIPIIFYTYNGVIGKSPDWINIAIFFISAAVAYVYETRKFNESTLKCKRPRLAFGLLCLLGVLFAAFTFITPTVGIFKDPLTGTFGI